MKHIAFNSGLDIWETDLFDSSVAWHHNEYQGTKRECQKEVDRQTNLGQPHYPNAAYGSIWDY